MHPGHTHVAVGHKGGGPAIGVYAYPTFQLLHRLEGGTGEEYSALAFSPDGLRLAAVGGAPDYTLSVWDWTAPRILLRGKAFSKPVRHVHESPWQAGRLVTSGEGHVKVWEMAETFTGLKLQGELLRLGAEGGEVTAVRELPDGRLVTASREGSLTLWRDGRVLSHSSPSPPRGPTQALFLQDSAHLLAVGGEGRLSLWAIPTPLPTSSSWKPWELVWEFSLPPSLLPLDALRVGPWEGWEGWEGFREDGGWVFSSSQGGLWYLSSRSPHPALSLPLPRSHAGKIVGLVWLPSEVMFVTAASDGSLLWSNPQKSVARLHGDSPVTCLTVVGTAGTVGVGLENGVVRLIDRERRLDSCKAFRGPVTCLSSHGEWLTCGSAQGEVFFFRTPPPWAPPHLHPVGFVTVPGGVQALAPHGTLGVVAVTSQGAWEVPWPSEEESAESTYALKVPTRVLDFPWASPFPSLSALLPYSPHSYLVAFKEFSGIFLWDPSVPVVKEVDTEFAKGGTLTWSGSGRLLLGGSGSGKLTAWEAVSSQDTVTLQPQWSRRLHGTGDCRVVSDSSDVFFASADSAGNIFVLSHGPSLPTWAEKEWEESAVERAEDQWSLEDRKQLAQQRHSALQQAEAQRRVEEEVEECRTALLRLRRRNAALPPPTQLEEREVGVEEGVREVVTEELLLRHSPARQLRTLRLQRKSAAVSALQQWFCRAALLPRIVLHACQSSAVVATFPLAELSRELQEQLEAVRQQALTQHPPSLTKTPSHRPDGPPANGARPGEREGKSERKEKGNKGTRTPGSNLEETKRRRELRAEEWRQFLASQPSDSLSPRDLEKLRLAAENMGDYPLKLSPHSKPSQLLPTTPKHLQLVLLQESAHLLRKGVNEQILRLRERKEELRQWLALVHSRLTVLHSSLGLPPPDPLPPTWEDEFPERELEGISVYPLPSLPDLSAVFERSQAIPSPPLDEEEQTIQQALWKWEQAHLSQMMKEQLEAFDQQVTALRAEKLRAEGELKEVELKSMVLQQEVALLKAFEKDDAALADKLAAKRHENAELTRKIEEMQTKRDSLVALLHSLDTQLQHRSAELHSLLAPLPSAQRDALLRLWRGSGKGEGEGDEEGEGDGEDLPEEGLAHPSDPAIPPGVMEQVQQQKEAKVALERERSEVRKGLEVTKKEVETLVKRKQLLLHAFASADSEGRALQRVKEERLNALPVGVRLRVAQIHFPPDAPLTEAVLFTRANLRRLRTRIGRLEEELQDQDLSLLALQKDLLALAKDKTAKKARNKQLEAKAEELQMLKFGQIINLESLEKKSVNKTADELKEQMRKESIRRAKELEAMEIERVKDSLTEETVTNTRLLQDLSRLSRRHSDLEDTLTRSAYLSFIPEYATAHPKEVAQQQQLLQTVAAQQSQLHSLRSEVQRLKGKGSIYRPL